MVQRATSSAAATSDASSAAQSTDSRVGSIMDQLDRQGRAKDANVSSSCAATDIAMCRPLVTRPADLAGIGRHYAISCKRKRADRQEKHSVFWDCCAHCRCIIGVESVSVDDNPDQAAGNGPRVRGYPDHVIHHTAGREVRVSSVKAGRVVVRVD